MVLTEVYVDVSRNHFGANQRKFFNEINVDAVK